MTPSSRLALPFLALVLAGCLGQEPAAGESAVAETAASAPAPVPVKPGDLMPPYTAQTLEGERFDLAGEKGKVLLVNVWATWCGPCRHEIPELVKLQNAYSKEGFEVLGISVDGNETAAAIPEMLQKYRVNYPVVRDPRGEIAELRESYVLPTS